MPWSPFDAQDAHRAAVFHDAHGIEVGTVIQFYEDGPTYPAVYCRRLGAFESWEAATKAVEDGDRLSRKE